MRRPWARREICAPAAIAACRAWEVAPKLGCRVVPTHRETRYADLLARAGPTGRRDRRAVGAHLDAATAPLLDLIREFDARGGWNTGFRSCAAWLSWRVGLDLGAARERVRVARALGTLPLLAQALAHGELSYAKVRALTRVATPVTEKQLLTFGKTGTAREPSAARVSR